MPRGTLARCARDGNAEHPGHTTGADLGLDLVAPPEEIAGVEGRRTAALGGHVAEAQRRRKSWHMDGQFRATMGQLPDEESASRWPGGRAATAR